MYKILRFLAFIDKTAKVTAAKPAVDAAAAAPASALFEAGQKTEARFGGKAK